MMLKPMTLAAMLVIVFAGFSPAAAEDESPCGDPYWHDGVGMEVQDCSMWRDSVPVVSSASGDGIHDEVGELVNAEGNWFTCQLQGSSYQVPGTDYVNDLWAATMADNGEWGFVSQAYFSGGDNNEPDGNLAMCTPSSGEESGGQDPDEGIPDPPEPTEPVPDDVEWSDCIWGGAPADAIVATFDAGDAYTYTLNCGNVIHIREGHDFNEHTIPCISRVLSAYDTKDVSRTDPRNDVFAIRNQEISSVPGNYVDAFVVTDRANLRVVTAYVEIKTIDLLPAYQGDPWAACVPVPTTA
jgi:hypothetical protein